MSTVVLKKAEFYEYTSTDGTHNVVITFETTSNQNLDNVLPAMPPSVLMDIEVS